MGARLWQAPGLLDELRAGPAWLQEVTLEMFKPVRKCCVPTLFTRTRAPTHDRLPALPLCSAFVLVRRQRGGRRPSERRCWRWGLLRPGSSSLELRLMHPEKYGSGCTPRSMGSQQAAQHRAWAHSRALGASLNTRYSTSFRLAPATAMERLKYVQIKTSRRQTLQTEARSALKARGRGTIFKNSRHSGNNPPPALTWQSRWHGAQRTPHPLPEQAATGAPATEGARPLCA